MAKMKTAGVWQVIHLLRDPSEGDSHAENQGHAISITEWIDDVPAGYVMPLQPSPPAPGRPEKRDTLMCPLTLL
jgi:hypothetical protein